MILSESHLSFEYKKDLIQSLFEGFDWDYYFKNYSIDHDVKLPGPFPERPTLAILEWISEIPLSSQPLEILNQLLSRGGLSSQALNKAIEIIVSNSNLEFKTKTQMLIKLIEKSRLYQAHYERIFAISDSFPEELKKQIQEAIPSHLEEKLEGKGEKSSKLEVCICKSEEGFLV